MVSGTGDWVESVPVPQVEEEGDGADHPRESEDKVFHQSLGCDMYSTVKSQLSNNIVQRTEATHFSVHDKGYRMAKFTTCEGASALVFMSEGPIYIAQLQLITYKFTP